MCIVSQKTLLFGIDDLRFHHLVPSAHLAITVATARVTAPTINTIMKFRPAPPPWSFSVFVSGFTSSFLFQNVDVHAQAYMLKLLDAPGPNY
jgi:hypothetical protein